MRPSHAYSTQSWPPSSGSAGSGTAATSPLSPHWRFWQSPETVGIVKDDDVLSALYYVRGYLDSSWDPPSATHLEYLRQARAKLGAALEELARFESEQVAPLRARLAAAGVGLLPERPPLALP